MKDPSNVRRRWVRRLKVVDQPPLIVAMCFRTTFKAHVLEMRVGLALSHVPPAAFFEEPLHEGIHVRATEVISDVPDFIKAFVVMLFDRLSSSRKICKGMAMGGEGEFYVTNLPDTIEGVEE